MHLVISAHARERMSERGISVADIERVLSHHGSSWLTPTGGLQFVGVAENGRELKVWVVPPGPQGNRASVIVKSAAWKDE